MKTFKQFLAEEPKITSDANLKAVLDVMKFDGDIPLKNDGSQAGKTSMNLANKLKTEGNYELWYVSIDPPDADLEAYVVSDHKGNFSYYDFTNATVVINNKIIDDKAPNDLTDAIEKVCKDFKIESPNPSDGVIAAYLEALNTK
jgi:hypothetical protein